MNITKWFRCKYELKKNSMPKYFVMNKNMIPEWSSEIDSNQYNLFGSIKLKKDFNQILILGITNKLEHEIIDQVYNINTKTNISILKSNLQKCIRRSKIKKAVRTGKLLLDIDPNELLRRLAIIYIEDVMIDNYFNNIVWYMAAVSKGFVLSSNDKLIILNIIEYLAKSEIKEEIPRIDNLDYNQYFSEMNSDILNYNFNSIWSLILRSKYGGMKCDIRMINGALKIYDQKKIKKIELEITNFDFKLKIKEKDIILEAIDFHCSKIIGILFKKKKIDYSENYQIYKKCIWDHRSKITNKIIINETNNNSLIDNQELYESIKDDLDSISKNIIKYQVNLDIAYNKIVRSETD